MVCKKLCSKKKMKKVDMEIVDGVTSISDNNVTFPAKKKKKKKIKK